MRKRIELNEAERRLAEDVQWARTAPEVQQHQGKLVVVRNKRVIAAGTDRPALVREAARREQCLEWDLTVVVVPRASLDEVPH